MVTAAATPLVRWYAVPLTRVPAASRQALLCGMLTVAAVLACRAWVEIGYVDDWSTARTARLFAETGQFIYNGWMHTPEGWQIVWTALFIKIFGFSYAVVRLSLLPVVFATVYFFQRCLVGFGMTEKNASFGALSLGLSPVFIPPASSYMTDVPGLFAVILCLFFCQKSVTATTNRNTCIWLTVAALTNLIFGTVRQTGWLGVLVIVPCVGLWLRHRKGVAAAAFTLTVVCGVGAAAVLRWFESHSFSVPEELLPAPITAALIVHLAGRLAMSLVFLALCVLPILAMFLEPLFRLRRRDFWLAYLALAVFVSLALALMNRSVINVADKLVEIAGKHQTIRNLSLILSRSTLHPSLWNEAAIIAGIGLALLLLRTVAFRKTVNCNGLLARPSWQAIFWLLGPYTLVYLALLMPRGSVGWIWDRYIIALAPLPIVSLLALYQERNGNRIPVIAVLTLAIVGFIGVARADRIYSENHARLIAADLLIGQGVRRTSISGGFEYDYETETDVSGHVNEPKVKVPANAYKPYTPPVGLPQCASDLVDSFTPSVIPKYFLVETPRACLAPTQYQPVSYKTMLPPFHRYIYLQQLPPE